MRRSAGQRAVAANRSAARAYEAAVGMLAEMPEYLVDADVETLRKAHSSIDYRLSELSRNERMAGRYAPDAVRMSAAVEAQAQQAWCDALKRVDVLTTLGVEPAPASGFIAMVGAVLRPSSEAALLSAVSLTPVDPFSHAAQLLLVPAASGSLEVLRQHVAHLRSFDQASTRTIPMLFSVEDRAVCETVAALWDPCGDGEYADPERTLAAARALVGPVSPVTQMLNEWQAQMRIKYRLRPAGPTSNARSI